MDERDRDDRLYLLGQVLPSVYLRLGRTAGRMENPREIVTEALALVDHAIERLRGFAPGEEAA